MLFKKISTALLISSVILLISQGSSSAAVLLQYNFLTDTNPSFSATNITGNQFSGGAGLSEVTWTNADGNPAGSWYGEDWSTSNDETTVRASNKYAYFRVTIDSGMSMSLTDLTFAARPHGSGPRKLLIDIIEVSGPTTGNLFGNIFNHSDPTQTGEFDDPSTSTSTTSTRKVWNTVSLSSSSFTNLTGTYEIRFYGYDAPQANREALIDNVILEGSVSPIPEPSSFLMCALGALAFLARRKR